MRRISNNQDLFEADPGEDITVTLEAKQVPYQVTFSTLETGNQWTVLQQPTPAVPIERRRFTQPRGTREFFMILYAFPSGDLPASNAEYLIKVEGKGATSDGPKDVLPPLSGNFDHLPYEFRLPNAETTAARTTMRTPRGKS